MSAAAMGHQLELLEGTDGDRPPELLERAGLRLRLWRRWLPDSETVQAALLAEVPWRQESINVWGRSHLQPRLTAWMADPGCAYRYSGLLHPPQAWSATANLLRRQVQEQVGCGFSSVLFNLYRDGCDRMGWHADDEPELDPAAPIASLSLGAPRSFQLRPCHPIDGERPTLNLELGDGDLLLMEPPTQQHWQHQLPQRRRIHEPRLNLTFRVVRPPSSGTAGARVLGRA